jgi:NitT/TauT family transport system substrate-binding protein
VAAAELARPLPSLTRNFPLETAMFATLRTAALAAACLAGVTSALATDLTVTHFGTGMYGVPFAIAREKGWFKSEAGIDVTGFITSAGGGTTVRNALASDIPYGEVALPAAIAAIQQGVKLTIVHGGVLSVADQVWIVRKDDTSINKFGDLKGKKLGYSSPKSVTDIITSVMLDKNSLTSSVERKSVGGIGSGLTALREGGVDMTYVTEPVWSKEKGSFRAAWGSTDIAPRVTQTVGIVRTDYLQKNPAVIRGIIAARRKGVEFVRANPAESAPIMAREYKIPVEEAKSAIESVLAAKGVYWSRGEFDYEGMEFMLNGLHLVKAIPDGPFDWSKVIDESFLPADLRSKK